MPFQYQPRVNPYVGSITDLMGRGTEARSRAELSAAEAEAGGQLRLGDITQKKWSGLGQTIGQGVDAYVTEQREAPIREQEARLRGLNIDRTEQLLAAGKVEAAQGEQERQRDATRDRILATAQTRFTGPNGEVDAEGATAWVQEQFALQLPPSYLEAYQVRYRAIEVHDALMTSHAARAEEAKLGTEAHRLDIERLKETDRLFKEMTRIDDTHGLDTPESDAAHLAYYGYTRTADPRIAIREGQLDRAARLEAALAPSATEHRYQRDFLANQYKGALESRDRAAVHAAEQALYQERIDPRTVRHSALKEIYNDEIKLHNLRVGAPGGTFPDPNRETMVDFDTWLQEANIPDVSTLGSVYAPPVPWEPGMPYIGVTTEDEIREQMAGSNEFASIEEAIAEAEGQGILVEFNEPWRQRRPSSPATDIRLPTDVGETDDQGLGRRRSSVFDQRGQAQFGEHLQRAADTIGSILGRTPGRRETSAATSRITHDAKDHGGLKGLADYVVNNRAEFEDAGINIDEYLAAIQRKIVIAAQQPPRGQPSR